MVAALYVVSAADQCFFVGRQNSMVITEPERNEPQDSRPWTVALSDMY